METIETNTTPTPDEPNGLLLLEDAQAYLHESGKWAKFLGIIGYIFTAFIILAGIAVSFVGSAINSMSASPFPIGMGPFLGVIYIVMGVFYFFFSNYLYQFGKSIISGVEYSDPIQISTGLRNLKSLFKFWGILTIVVMAIYALVIIGIVVAGVFAR